MERLRSPDNVWSEMVRGILAARRGDRATANAVIDRLEKRAASGEVTLNRVGAVYLELGDSDQFVACMESSFRIHRLPLLELLYSPLFQSARSGPRIVDLLRRQAELRTPDQ
jgi:hypothetical protein